MKLVCISDTHGIHDRMRYEIPDGDILLHAGDVTRDGRIEDLTEVESFFAAQPHRHKVFIPGNHDWIFEQDLPKARGEITSATCLVDEFCEINGMKIWGSPWQPEFHNWAFNLRRGEALARVWSRIPDDMDIVITHGPPAGILDLCSDGKREGCHDLAERIRDISPKLHLFGHIHEAYGREIHGKTIYVNASICNLGYHPVNQPIVVELPECSLDSCMVAP